MKLPDAAHLRVDREKITDYLLSPSHPDGASKARFFSSFGFRIEEWQALAEALREHGRTHMVAFVMESAFGTRYTVEGELETPSRRRPRVRSVWILEEDSTTPRLITAYPA